jgi:hypothetical protein
MADKSKLRVTELDFDNIKSNLKTFLSSQSELTDYDFEGSTMAVLLDMLAYNTHYNAIYANLVANEMFLDSASKRSSVVSLAKHFGYTPRSRISPRANINLQVVVTGTPTTLTLPKYTAFTTTLDGTDYTFYNMSSITTTPISANTFLFTNVEIVEGVPLSYRYTAANDQNTFVIPNLNIDLSTLNVEVQNSGSDSTKNTYVRATEVMSVTATDKVFFVEETRDGLYQLVFGDGVIGKALTSGNIVYLSYLTSNAATTNNANSFNLGTTAGFTVSSSVITLNTKALGGKERESVDSIKFNATKFFNTQNRAVTSEDYKNIIIGSYGAVDAISVWGGEENVPPIYGKVFICAKPANGLTFSDADKGQIRQLLRNKNVVGITPEFIDPEYLYMTINVDVQYDPSMTSVSGSTLQANIITTVLNYRDSELDNFDTVFRRSKVSRLVDYTNKAILSNNINTKLFKMLSINTELAVDYTIRFVNPIRSVETTAFRLVGDSKDYYFADNGKGTLVRYHYNNNERVDDDTQFGSIDYVTGTLVIPQVAFSLLTNSCRIYAVQENPDINSVRNQILTILDDDITVNTRIDIRKPLIR